ncbi:MAG: thiamine diphosphokinase [Candidatus Puniceispirillaceae bacterium]
MSSGTETMLRYTTPVILVGASPVPVADTLSILPPDWPLLAADGGANALLDLGRRPEMVIGDMDSARPLPDDLPRMALSGQDDTDLQKCLARIETPLLVGLGFLDGRFDHGLAAIHALMRLDHDRPVMLVGMHDVMLRVRGDISFDAEAGCRVSIWPLGDQAFGLSAGLRWQLDGLHMAAGSLIGTSNEAEGGPVTIRAGAGTGYAVILPRAALPKLLDAVMPQAG